MNDRVPNREELLATMDRLTGVVHQTPVLTSQSIDREAGAEIYFKCENFQKVGAFKFRGASNAMLCLPEEKRRKGIATHSSGNHAQAVALAARMQGVPAYIVMPNTAPKIKIRGVEAFGGKITFCEPTLQAREDTLEEVVAETGAHFIHAYNNYDVIAGQSTACQELIQETPHLDIIMAPVGGGGLLSGTALAARHFSPDSVVIAGEPAGADDAARSLAAGELIPSVNPNTISDGLLTSLGHRNFPIIRDYVREILVVDDEATVNAMRLVWERMKIVIEPSCAVPLAAVLENKEKFTGKKVGIILSGGNVDLDKLPF